MQRISRPIVVLVLVSLVGCATTVERASSDDPFSNHLDMLYAKRQTAENWLFASALALTLGVIGSTTFSTLYSLDRMNHQTATIGIICSYSLSGLATGWGTYQFFVYRDSFNEYLETLRLQQQYWNEVQFSK